MYLFQFRMKLCPYRGSQSMCIQFASIWFTPVLDTNQEEPILETCSSEEEQEPYPQTCARGSSKGESSSGGRHDSACLCSAACGRCCHVCDGRLCWAEGSAPWPFVISDPGGQLNISLSLRVPLYLSLSLSLSLWSMNRNCITLLKTEIFGVFHSSLESI